MSKQDLFSKVVVFDTETTSKDFKEAEVVEFCFGGYQDQKWQAQFSSFYLPSEPIKPEVSAITHITNKHVAGAKPFIEDRDAIVELFQGEGVIAVAHNIFYDAQVLKRYEIEVPTQVCTMKMARKLFGEDPTVTEFNLSYLRYRFELEVPEDVIPHRAEADVIVTSLLFEYLVDVAIERGELIQGDLTKSLIDWINEPVYITVMPFGKHKGKKMTEVPLSYWQWALENFDSLQEDKPEYDPSFAASVNAALDKILEDIDGR